jgi:VIT1/CCC1 family predicted Fe2+/Mn2+ transporter
MASAEDQIYIRCEPVTDVETGITVEEVNQIRLLGMNTTSGNVDGRDYEDIKKKNEEQNIINRKFIYSMISAFVCALFSIALRQLHIKGNETPPLSIKERFYFGAYIVGILGSIISLFLALFLPDMTE